MFDKADINVADFEIYNKLPIIDDVERVGSRDVECLKEMRAVLEKHGMLSRFGVTLLHKHFDLKEGEIILEETDEETRTQTLKPVRAADYADQQFVQTNFSLVEGEALVSCFLKCWVSGGKHTKEHTTFSS